jgi:GNAT superfamily N-acetyltransferase
MTNNPSEAKPYRSTVRRAVLAEVHDAVAIIREAATWAAARGIDVWAPLEIREEAFEASARKAELLIGFADTTPAATMLLQTEDPVYWPNEAPASALYLHKVAVRRSFAGQGWLARLIDFAVVEANSAGIPRLRLDTILRPKLRSMYEQHGFRVLEEEPLLVYGKQMIRMERLLRPS